MASTTEAARTAPEPTIRGPASGKQLRPFALKTPDGREVRSRTYQQRNNLVLVFHHGAGCPACREALSNLAAHEGEIQAAAGKVLAVGPDQSDSARQMASELEPGVTVLGDSGEATAERQGVSVPAIVVTDRFGEIWAAWEGGADHRLPTADEVVEWLDFIEIQCPECHPPEPWA